MKIKTYPLQFTEEYLKHIEEVAKKQGKTIKDFILETIKEKIEKWKRANRMTRLEQRKNSVEKTLKDFKIPYEAMYDRRYFKITYQGHKLLLEVTNRYIDIRNRKDTMSYGFFEGVTDFRYSIENGYSLID